MRPNMLAILALGGILNLPSPVQADEGSAGFVAPDRLGTIAARKCEKRTDSGLGYSMLETGIGVSPEPADRVRVAYAGYFLSNGAKFDGSPSSAFRVNGVIPGFSEGLQLMQRGATYRLCIPARLGYGARGAGNVIPPNSHLIFLVQLQNF